MHGLHARGGIGCWESLDRRQRYKGELLTEHYNAQVSVELADRLLYVDRQRDQTVITLRGYAGAVAGRVVDKGDRMAASRRGNDTEILALIDLARTKGWQQIHITGSESFKARAYIEATRAGLAVVAYEASPEIRAQLLKEKTMPGQAGAGMMALTPDSTINSSPFSRWIDSLLAAGYQLEDERQKAREQLKALLNINLHTLRRDLLAEAANTTDPKLHQLNQSHAEASSALASAGPVTRWIRERDLRAAEAAVAVHEAKVLSSPRWQARLQAANAQIKQRQQLEASLVPLTLGIEETKYWIENITNKRDPEADFLAAWQRRKTQPLQLWQEYALTPAFEADAARERARLQVKADLAEQAKQTTRQEQIQREIAAQKQADAIEDQLGQPGLTTEQEEMLEQQHRYYRALADGHSEEDAKERAAKKSDAPRPH